MLPETKSSGIQAVSPTVVVRPRSAALKAFCGGAERLIFRGGHPILDGLDGEVEELDGELEEIELDEVEVYRAMPVKETHKGWEEGSHTTPAPEEEDGRKGIVPLQEASESSNDVPWAHRRIGASIKTCLSEEGLETPGIPPLEGGGSVMEIRLPLASQQDEADLNAQHTTVNVGKTNGLVVVQPRARRPTSAMMRGADGVRMGLLKPFEREADPRLRS